MGEKRRADPELSRKFLLMHDALDQARQALAPALLPGADLRAVLLDVEKALDDGRLAEIGDFRKRLDESSPVQDGLLDAFTTLHNEISLARSCLRWHLGPHKGFITDEGCILALLVGFDSDRVLNAGKFEPLRQDFPRQAEFDGGLIFVEETEH